MKAMHIKLSAKGNHLVFIDAVYQDSIAVAGTVKIGVLAIEEGAKTDKVLAFAKKQDWTMDNRVLDANGDETEFYLVERA